MSAVNANTVVVTGTGQASSVFTVAHGIPGVPAAVHITGLGATATAALPIKVTAVDGTNASFTFANAITNGTGASVMYTAFDGS